MSFATAFAGTGINVTGNLNNIGIWNITGAGQFDMNVTGTSNTIKTATLNATQRGINLVGIGNTITFSSLNTTAAQGMLYLHNTATANTINDIDFATHVPVVNIYNSTTFKNVTAWYFYNQSWSISGSNMNVTINVSPLYPAIPLAGNVGIAANFSDVTIGASDINSSRTLPVNESGYSWGNIYNLTEKTKFAKFPVTVPVNFTFGNNNFGSKYQEFNIGQVVILNFNPVNSTPLGTGAFNVTGTTNWTTIPDFTNAENVTFVVDSGTTAHTLYGNLSFLDPLDLASSSTGTALAKLGTALSISATGGSIKLDTTSGTGIPALNKQAILKVYPTNFAFTEGSTNIRVTADGTQIYNQGSWNKAGYVSNSATITVGNGNITLPVLHFTQYDFGEGVNPAPESGGGAAPGAAVAPAAVAVGESKTVSVNVGGGSAISRVAVTGTGINDVIVTALTHTDLPASITPPATTVYQYMTVSPARYTTISSVTFNFNVPASWLAEKGYTKNDIVMTLWDPDAKTWTSLPTSIISENQGVITYQVIAPHMSEFAVVYQKGAAAQAQANVTAIQTSVPLKTTTTYMTTTPSIRPTTPTPTQTVAPAASTPPTGGTPVTTIVIAVVGIVVIVVGAFLVHRWWIRRQNPELFKELK